MRFYFVVQFVFARWVSYYGCCFLVGCARICFLNLRKDFARDPLFEHLCLLLVAAEDKTAKARLLNEKGNLFLKIVVQGERIAPPQLSQFCLVDWVNVIPSSFPKASVTQ